MIKLRIMSHKQDNDLFCIILKELERIDAIKIIEQSRPYANRGNSIAERIYFDIEINPDIKNDLPQLNNANKN